MRAIIKYLFQKGTSGSNSESNSEGLAPSKTNSVSQGNTIVKLNPSSTTYEFDSSSGNIYAKDLPEATSNIWVKGFLWKGVYFKLYSKKEGQLLKREMRALKHTVIEYLQTESCFRLVEGLGSNAGLNIIGMNENTSQDLNKSLNQTLQVIPPLISFVEGSSWMLLGTPVFSRKKGGVEDSIAKVLQIESHGFFKNSFLLSRADARNFKLYNKSDEQIYGGQTHNTLSGSMLGQQQLTSYLLLSNANRLVFSLPKVQSMFMIAQDENVNIMFTEFPQKGFLDYNQIKKMLGYRKYDVNLTNLKRRKVASVREDPPNVKLEDAYIFELVKFKKCGWNFHMIYINPKDKTKNMNVNYRATALLAKSDRIW